MDSQDVTEASRAAGDSALVQWGARAGFVLIGGLNLIIAWLAFRVAWGGGGDADTSGALTTLASSTTGRVLLWCGVAGFALIAVWALTEAVIRRDEITDLAKLLGKAGAYAFYAWACFKVVGLGRGSEDGDEKVQSVTAIFLGSPIGRVLVGIAGLVVIGVGLYQIVKGVTSRFLEDLEDRPGTALVAAGRIGYTAKGIAVGLIGYFLIQAAWTADPEKSEGLDGALKTFKEAPAGPYLLTVVAAGFAAYAVYSFGRARYARL